MFRFAQHDKNKNKIAGSVLSDPAMRCCLLGGELFFGSLAGFHLYVGSRHSICDGYLVSDLNVTGDFGIGVTIYFPALLPFLDRNH